MAGRHIFCHATPHGTHGYEAVAPLVRIEIDISVLSYRYSQDKRSGEYSQRRWGGSEVVLLVVSVPALSRSFRRLSSVIYVREQVTKPVE